jgi:cell division protein FtsB
VDDRILEIVVVAGAALFGLVVFVVKDQLQAQRKRAEADAALAREFKERDA